MSPKEVRFLGLTGIVTILVFLAAFVIDPAPPFAGASSSEIINHAATFSGNDRTAAFFFALSGAGLLVLASGLRQWLAELSSAPRWWGTAMVAGSILSASSLVSTSVIWFTLSSHASLTPDIATTLSEAANYGYAFAGFGVAVFVGSATAILLTMYGPLSYLGRFGFVVTLAQVPYLLTAFFTSGPMQAGSVIFILGFMLTGLWVALVSITLLVFARLAAAAAR